MAWNDRAYTFNVHNPVKYEQTVLFVGKNFVTRQFNIATPAEIHPFVEFGKDTRKKAKANAVRKDAADGAGRSRRERVSSPHAGHLKPCLLVSTPD